MGRAAALIVLALATPQEDLDRRRDALAARLETLRGLKFTAPLKVREGTRKEYSLHVLENARRSHGGDLAGAELGLKALGLVPAKMKVELALTAQGGFGTKAFCSGGELVLLDRQADDEWWINKMALGLSDQHHPTAGSPTYDGQMAVAALRMGEAEIAKHLLRTGGKITAETAMAIAGETETWEKGDSKLASAVAPRFFVRSADFPWRRGGLFAVAVVARGGLAALDRVWSRPPATTEQVLHPEKYDRDERAVVLVPAPLETLLAVRGWAAAHRTVLGELGTALVLETHFPREDVASASAGWGGDTLAVYARDGAPAMAVWATEWDSEQDAREFESRAVAVAQRLSAPDENRLAHAERRKTSVLLAANVPKELRLDVIDAVWRSRRTRTVTDAFGD